MSAPDPSLQAHGKQLPCPSSRSSCSMPVLVAPDFRVPHPSSASFEHSLHSFCLPHIYPAQSSPSNSVCLWLAPFCVPQHHIWLPKVILTFFFFFSVGCTSLLEQASRAVFFQGCLCSDRIFFTIFLKLSGFFFPGLKLSWPPGSRQISDCLVLEEDYCDECFDITHEHMLLIASGNKVSSTQRGRQ